MSRILLVDDDRDVALLMEQILLDAGYAVDCAASVADARARLATETYDLVLTDGKLGDGSGVVVADEATDRGMKSLIVTGYMLQLSKAALNRHEVLMKPVRAAQLLAAVERKIGTAAR